MGRWLTLFCLGVVMVTLAGGCNYTWSRVGDDARPERDGGSVADAAADGGTAVDAADPCGGNCSPPGVCVGGVCCLPEGSTETDCNDGEDNDCDGHSDCADTDCDEEPCNDGDNDTTNDACDSSAGMCVGEPCTWVQVCDQCNTGDCEDVLIHEDPGCGCQQSVAAPNCDMTNSPYNVPCGGGYYCTFERRHITEDCDCYDECQP